MYRQHDPAPRLPTSQARLMSATALLTASAPNPLGQTTRTVTDVPLPSPSLRLSHPTPPSHAIPQPGPLPLPLRPSQLPTSSQTAVGRAVPFYHPGPSRLNQSLGVTSTMGVATPLPYSMYTSTPPVAAGSQALGKRKRSRGRASQLLECVGPRRYELSVVIDCQAVSR